MLYIGEKSTNAFSLQGQTKDRKTASNEHAMNLRVEETHRMDLQIEYQLKQPLTRSFGFQVTEPNQKALEANQNPRESSPPPNATNTPQRPN